MDKTVVMFSRTIIICKLISQTALLYNFETHKSVTCYRVTRLIQFASSRCCHAIWNNNNSCYMYEWGGFTNDGLPWLCTIKYLNCSLTDTFSSFFFVCVRRWYIRQEKFLLLLHLLHLLLSDHFFLAKSEYFANKSEYFSTRHFFFVE